MRYRRNLTACVAIVAALFSASSSAWAQPKKGDKSGAPPTTGTDMELDPDAKPPEPKPKEELPPAKPDDWGVGGPKEEDGKFAPGGEKKAKADDDHDDIKITPPPPGVVDVDLVIGFGKFMNPVDDQNPTSMTSLSFVFGARYQIADLVTLGVRVPLANGNTKGPLGNADAYATNAIGAITLDTRIDFAPTRRLTLPVGVSIALPTGAGDALPDPTDTVAAAQFAVNQAAGAARGWESQALFASKRFGLTPMAGLTYRKNAFTVGGETKLELLLKTGGNAAGNDSRGQPVELHAPNTNWVTTIAGSYAFLDGKLEPELRAWFAVFTQPVFVGTRDYSSAQLVLEPRVGSRIPINSDKSLQVQGQVGFILPIAGQLAGKNGATAHGIRLHAGFLF
jgi:hypothetical protein